MLKKAYITQAQLLKALGYQTRRKIKLGTALLELKFVNRKQLNSALRRQYWLRTLTTFIALACTPFSSALSTELPERNHVLDIKSVQTNLTRQKNRMAQINNGFHFSEYENKQAKEFFITKRNQFGFSFSESSGIQISLYTKPHNDYQVSAVYEFEPQISLFKSSFDAPQTSQARQRITDRINHYSKPIPVVYMLSLKGRSLAESSGKKTAMWSLSSANKGVQRKAELMFSITKQF